MAFSGNQRTRLAQYGGPGRKYRSFAGKTEARFVVGACWAQGQGYVPGFKAGERYLAGFKQGQRVC